MKFDIKTPFEHFDDLVLILRERGLKIRGNVFSVSPWFFASTFSSRKFVHCELKGSCIMIDLMEQANSPCGSPLCVETLCFDVGSISFDYISFTDMCYQVEKWIVPNYIREWIK